MGQRPVYIVALINWDRIGVVVAAGYHEQFNIPPGIFR
jgi:hypothetical protein